MTRFSRRAAQVALDLSVLALAFALAFALRFEWAIPGDMLRRLAVTLPWVVAAQYLVLVVLGVPRFSWRYVGLREVTRIGLALGICGAFLVGARLLSAELMETYSRARYGLVPFGVIAIDYMLAFLGLSGLRALRRMVGERVELGEAAAAGPDPIPTMLVGAGRAGLAVVKEISGKPNLRMKAVGILDDDPAKIGTVLHGVPVLGSTEELANHCADKGAEQVLIAIARVSGREVRRITRATKEAGLRLKIIPPLSELVDGNVTLNHIREVKIDDLLRRDPVDLDQSAISANVRDRAVMVTGAGGSIGSELCRQLAAFRPSQLLLVERAENALFEVHRELIAKFPQLEIVPVVADVTDRRRMKHVFGTREPTMVFHAAAHKHVPMMEWNPSQAIINNVVGTRVVAEEAAAAGVDAFVLVSTDKAVRPSSLMGASKRAAELFVQGLSGGAKTRFGIVRFGNVLGSAGSVVPIFKEQIRRGGPVTVTHAEMTRYFMTVPEACQLVLQAATMGEGGEIFILDMGSPVKIVDLAHDLIRLSGLQPGVDIDLDFVGIRPGEKLHEELSYSSDLNRTKHPSIMVEGSAVPDGSEVVPLVDELIAAARDEDVRALLHGLANLIGDLSLEALNNEVQAEFKAVGGARAPG